MFSPITSCYPRSAFQCSAFDWYAVSCYKFLKNASASYVQARVQMLRYLLVYFLISHRFRDIQLLRVRKMTLTVQVHRRSNILSVSRQVRRVSNMDCIQFTPTLSLYRTVFVFISEYPASIGVRLVTLTFQVHQKYGIHLWRTSSSPILE